MNNFPFRRFGACATKAWEFALDHRKRSGLGRMHRGIMTGHLLLGVLSEPSCAAGILLRKMSLELGLAMDVTSFMLRYSRRVDGIEDVLEDWNDELHTPSTLQAIRYAFEEADLFHTEYPIGTEHLVLGLLRVRSSLASSALNNLGISTEAFRVERDTFWNALRISEGQAYQSAPSPL